MVEQSSENTILIHNYADGKGNNASTGSEDPSMRPTELLPIDNSAQSGLSKVEYGQD